MRIFFAIMLLLPFVATAQESSTIQLFMERAESGDVVFDIPGGSQESFTIFVKNDTDKKSEIRILMSGEGGSLVENTRFFDEMTDPKIQTILEENKNDIITLCSKNDLQDEIKKWCLGIKQLSFVADPGQEKQILVRIAIDSAQTAQEANLVVEQKNALGEYERVQEQKIQYHPPEKDVALLQVSNFTLDQKFGPLDVQSWFSAGMKELYGAHYLVENRGIRDVKYTSVAKVYSHFIGDEVYYEETEVISRGEKKETTLELRMPRFGKVQITGSVTYTDQNDVLQEIQSEPIEIFVWPATLFLLIMLGGCFCLISVLLYKYLKKNMFGFKKKNEKKDESGFGGTYTVQDADNIISIAQHYNISWKELAKQNGIEPPYILISGETIKVPGEADESISQSQKKQAKEKKNVADQWGGKFKEKQENIVQSTTEDSHDNQMLIENKEQELSAPKQNAIAEDMTVASQKSVNTSHEKKEVEKEQKKKRKVTFASPKNMLTKPSSEPTTRAIDIEWMRDDEIAYMEEMEVQEKKTNRKFIAVIVISVLIVGIVIWYGVVWFMEKNKGEESVSVDTLITEQSAEKEKKKEEMNASQVEAPKVESDVSDDHEKKEENNLENLQDNNPDKEEVTAKESDIKETEEGQDKESVSENNKEVSVQVLNAGAPTGAAGAVSSEIKKAGFTTKAAQNAQNDYENVVIYYKKNLEDVAKKIGVEIDEKYGVQKVEESDDVAKKYGVDIVVVLGT
ncbi:MAG: hypothetical protein CR972_02455 [Candidatus Moraniibacteriota bacterium]|nr:MAG: hypothetical protein CR972_02455 [Candidatus Moranbacteria bacterium]